MLLNALLENLDKIFCRYLRKKIKKNKPYNLRIRNNQLIVTRTIPFKRHILQEQRKDFDVPDFKKLHRNDREKIGLATGKAIAKGLAVSFEEVSIDKSKCK